MKLLAVYREKVINLHKKKEKTLFLANYSNDVLCGSHLKNKQLAAFWRDRFNEKPLKF